MNNNDIIKTISIALNDRKIIWNKHALERMMQRGITRTDVLTVLTKYEIIEKYLDDYPYPSYLLLGFYLKNPLHIVLGVNKEEIEIYVITVYKPSLSKFMNDFKTRRV